MQEVELADQDAGVTAIPCLCHDPLGILDVRPEGKWQQANWVVDLWFGMDTKGSNRDMQAACNAYRLQNASVHIRQKVGACT